MALATLLVLLLVLHHPLMGVQPSPATLAQGDRPTFGVPVSMAVHDNGFLSVVSWAGEGGMLCPACPMTCPLMQGVAPARLTVPVGPVVTRHAGTAPISTAAAAYSR